MPAGISGQAREPGIYPQGVVTGSFSDRHALGSGPFPGKVRHRNSLAAGIEIRHRLRRRLNAQNHQPADNRLKVMSRVFLNVNSLVLITCRD